jgi:membrane protease YdiL (CAAX protease family)
MGQIITEFISAILQVIGLTLVPFIFFLFRKDKEQTFFKYIGITKPTIKSVIIVFSVAFLFVIIGVGLAIIDEGWKQALLSPNSVTGKIRLMELNMTSVSILLITALIKTSLSEEIFFRGFIAKRLTNKLGFKKGNFLQSFIFGFMHLLLFGLLTKITFIPLIVIFVFSTLAGWSIGYVKEKYANGSIVPGWIAHGLGNTLSYFIIAFII